MIMVMIIPTNNGSFQIVAAPAQQISSEAPSANLTLKILRMELCDCTANIEEYTINLGDISCENIGA